jgi:predicted ABC-type transport system involved in lysophospholipase L1 biosynthesis ATPase subunit
LVNKILFIFLLSSLASCVFIPAVSPEQPTCILHTKKLVLKTSESKGALGARCTGEACLVILGAASAVALSTLIVSGSIVLVGNTVHWLEKEGTCDDGYIKIKIEEFYKLIGVNEGVA